MKKNFFLTIPLKNRSKEPHLLTYCLMVFGGASVRRGKLQWANEMASWVQVLTIKSDSVLRIHVLKGEN